jgi:hypothetical protein
MVYRARVDGGGGIDVLQLEGADLTLDLTKISDRRIQDIEVIDITGSGDNTLRHRYLLGCRYLRQQQRFHLCWLQYW